MITATGRADAVSLDLISRMPDGLVLANARHVETEIDTHRPDHEAPGVELAPSLERHDLPNGRSVFVLADGRIFDLTAEGGIGKPIEAMDRGLTLQARSLAALVDPRSTSTPAPNPCLTL